MHHGLFLGTGLPASLILCHGGLFGNLVQCSLGHRMPHEPEDTESCNGGPPCRAIVGSRLPIWNYCATLTPRRYAMSLNYSTIIRAPPATWMHASMFVFPSYRPWLATPARRRFAQPLPRVPAVSIPALRNKSPRSPSCRDRPW